MSDKQTSEIEKSAATQIASQGATESATESKETKVTTSVEGATESKETKVTTSADGGTITKTTETKSELVVVSGDQKDTKQTIQQESSLVETKTASQIEVHEEAIELVVEGATTTTAHVIEARKVVKEEPQVAINEQVTQIKSNLQGILDTPSGTANKLEFKEEDCSKSDNGSQENVEKIEYVKINENALLNDDWKVSIDQTYQTGTFNTGFESSAAQGHLYSFGGGQKFGEANQFTTVQLGGGFATGQFSSGIESYKVVKEDLYKDFDTSKFASSHTIDKSEIYRDFVPSSNFFGGTSTTFQTIQTHVPQFTTTNYQFDTQVGQTSSATGNFQFQVEKDFKIDYEKDFKFDFVTDNKVTEYKQSDFKIEDFTKQNDEMFKSIEQTSFGKTEFTINEPAKQEFNVTELKSTIVESNEVDESKNINFIQEAESRHQSQVEGLYSQISSQETKYMQQISELQMEKSELEKKLVLAERKYTELGQSMELKFQEQLTKIQGEHSSMSSQHESYKFEIQRLTQALQEQEKRQLKSMEVIRQHESHQSGFRSQYEGLVFKMKEAERIINMKNEELRAISIKATEMEKKFVAQIQAIYSEKAEQERRFSEQSSQLMTLQQKYTDLEVNVQLKVEQATASVSQTQTVELEKKHQYQIERMYAQITELESKHQSEVYALNQKCSELSVKQIVKVEDPRIKMELEQLKHRNQSLEANIQQQSQMFQQEKSSIMSRFKSEIESVKQSSIQNEMRLQQQISQVQQTRTVDNSAEIKAQYEERIGALEKMHAAQTQKLYTKMKEHESQFETTIRDLRSQNIFLEKKHEEASREIKRAYAVNQQQAHEKQTVTQEKIVYKEADGSKYLSEIQTLKNLNSDIVRQHALQIQQMNKEMSQLKLRHESELKSAREESSYMQTKVIGLQEVAKKVEHYQPVEAKVITRQDSGLLRQVSMYEQKHSEMMSEIMSLRQRLQEAQTASRTTTVSHQNEQRMIGEMKMQLAAKTQEIEKKYQLQSQQLYQSKAHSEQLILHKTEEINKLMVQLQSVERKFQSQISQLHSEFSEKERTLVQQIQSFQTSQASVANVERQHQSQIQHFESQITEMKSQMQAQSSSYQSQMSQMEKQFQVQISQSQSQGQDEIKVYQIEMKKLQTKLTEVYERNKSEQLALVQRKQYLEKQRALFNVEIKKLFEINADLEQQVANLKLEVQSFESTKTLTLKKNTEETEALYASSAESEKKTVEKIEEIKSLQLKISEMEKSHAASIKNLTEQMTNSESKYLAKVEEFSTLQQSHSELQVSNAQSSQHIKKATESETTEITKTQAEVAKFKQINIDLAKQFNQQLYDLQQKNSMYESREAKLIKAQEVLEINQKETHAMMVKTTEEKYAYEKKYMATITLLEGKIAFLEQKCLGLLQGQVTQQASASYEYKTETNFAPIELKTETFTENIVAPSFEFKEFKMEDIAVPSSTFEYKVQDQNIETAVEVESYNVQQIQSENFFTKTENFVADQIENSKQDAIIEIKVEDEACDDCETKLAKVESEKLIIQEQSNELTQKVEKYEQQIVTLKQGVETDSMQERRKLTTEENIKLKERLAQLEKKQQKLETKYAKSKETIRTKGAKSNISANDGQSSFGGTALSEFYQDSNMFFHEQFQAKKGYDTSNMVNFAQSIPNIPELSKKSKMELQKLSLKKVEWSTVSNKFQQPSLQSIKFHFSDGSSTAEWGKKDATTAQTYEFKDDDHLTSIGFDYGNFYVLQMTFYGKDGKEIVKCGNVGADTKVKKVKDASKIIYAFGASSIDNKCVGMVGFTFNNIEEKKSTGAPSDH